MARADRYRVTNITRQTTLADRSARAADPIRRGVGLMGRKGLAEGEALIIDPCNGIVSFFMRFRFDAVFLDADGRVCHLVENMPPWRASKIVRGSKRVVELPAGVIERTGTELGDQLDISPAA
ncbi:MAG TPA: DUF192 domain-containing protein [Chloroflexota bacterium]|nr:DUF192 domain-containing protein [Chloroflexota bacterium]